MGPKSQILTKNGASVGKTTNKPGKDLKTSRGRVLPDIIKNSKYPSRFSDILPFRNLLFFQKLKSGKSATRSGVEISVTVF